MANRNFPNSRIYTGHVMPVLLDANANIGAAGAVSSSKGSLIASFSRLGVGKYQIIAQDPYARLYNVQCSVQSPSAGVSAGVASIELDPASNVSASGGASIIIQCFDSAGAAKELANGSVLFVSIYMSNSSVLVGNE